MFVLPPLPYASDALDPVISQETLETHHGAHHAGYVKQASEFAALAGLAGEPLEEVVCEARRRGDTSLSNNAAQAWNHGFYWCSMAAERTRPADDLAVALDQAFGDIEQLKELFVGEGTKHFASGWTWLVVRDGALEVISTHDADNPLSDERARPLLVCDLWEHAYYLDYNQARADYLGWWFDELADWRFAGAQFAAALSGRPGYSYPPPERG